MFPLNGSALIWLVLLLVLVIFFLAKKGKLSPGFVILLLLGTSLLSTILWKTSDSISFFLLEESRVDKDSLQYDIISAVGIPEKTGEEETTSKKVILDKSAPKIKSIKDVVHQEFRTYNVNGFWEWEDFFVTAITEEAGWRKVKKGNRVITIEHTGSFKQQLLDNASKFVYSGGYLQFKVDGEACCCGSTIVIEGKIADPKLAIAKEKLVKKTTSAIAKHQTEIIKQLKHCLTQSY